MKIYFDMDGVLANFNKGVKDLLGMTPRDQGAGFDFKWYNKLYAKMREVDHYYDKLEPIQEVVELLLELYDKYGDDVQILTAIPKPNRGIVTAADDKVNWTGRLISPDIKVNIVYRADKVKFCQGKDCILIDDFDKNVNEWEEIGGTGLLYSKDVNLLRAQLRQLNIL